MSAGLGSRAIIGNFYRRLEESYDASWVSRVSWRQSSNQQYEEYRFADATPPMRKWTGQRAPHTLSDKKIIVANDVWDSSLNIPVDDLRRDKTGQITARVSELAKRATLNMETQVASLVTAGGSTVCYDDQYFFDSDHSEGSSGSQTNLLTNTEVPALNVGTAAAPTEAEASQAILNATMKFFGLLDDKGEPINGDARDFAILCPINLAGAFLGGIYNAQVRDTSGVSTSNPIPGTGFKYSLHPTPKLTTTTVFYIFRTDGTTKPFIIQEEVGVQMKALAEGSDYAVENRSHLYAVEWIGGFGYGQWQHALHCTLS